MFTLAFWRAAAERAVKTGAQSVLTVYFVGDVALNAFEADWVNMAGIGLGGVAVSLLTSLASGYKDGNPSAINAETVTQNSCRNFLGLARLSRPIIRTRARRPRA